MPPSFLESLTIKSFIASSSSGLVPVTISFTPHYFPFGLRFEGISQPKVLKKRMEDLFRNLSLTLPQLSLTIRIRKGETYEKSPHSFSVSTEDEISFLIFPTAVGFFIYLGLIPSSICEQFNIVGLLARTGDLIFTPGILPIAFLCSQEHAGLICPFLNGTEALWVLSKKCLISPPDLRSLALHFMGTSVPAPTTGFLVGPSTCERHLTEALFSDEQLRLCERAIKNQLPLLLINFFPLAQSSSLTSVLWKFWEPLTSEAIFNLNCSLSLLGKLSHGHLFTGSIPCFWPEKPLILFPDLKIPRFLMILENPFSWGQEEIEAFINYRISLKNSTSSLSWIIVSGHPPDKNLAKNQRLLKFFHNENGVTLRAYQKGT